ncbi:receptor-type tyrosine-protein phosphatase mu isoform X3 [Procambarus clarkii]|uniref:receptor-type tyrosine-protein phosphatase mu isoform X3 n=1 Tax=Procambarus clarkii TaxID=6728 RepID=UPI003742080B
MHPVSGGNDCWWCVQAVSQSPRGPSPDWCPCVYSSTSPITCPVSTSPHHPSSALWQWPGKMAARTAKRLIIILMSVGVYGCLSLSLNVDDDSSGVTVSPVRSPRRSLRSTTTRAPDITMVYPALGNFTGRVLAYCVPGHPSQRMEAHIVPGYYSSPTIQRDGDGSVRLKWGTGVEITARGVVCSALGTPPHYNVSAPLMNNGAWYVPEQLSVTVSKGEDLRLRFTLRDRTTPRQVLWQKEPVSSNGWQPSKSNLTDDNQFIIPADKLTGSGFYSVIPYTSAKAPGSDKKQFGTFSLLVRECPAGRYGKGCNKWCPDCMYGGVCHPVTGECICPPYLSGDRCQTRCDNTMMGRDCTVKLPEPWGKQVCLPHPLGCHCAPGYTGDTCTTECGRDRWGVECSQTCRHHCQGDCHPHNGYCHSPGPADCAGGDLGLPRLRRPPQVINVSLTTARVTFDGWNSGYDDGHKDEDHVITYRLQLWVTDEGTESAFSQTATPGQPNTVNGLQPATGYSMQVLLQVSRDGRGQACVADGTGRERVHTVSFNTPCPDTLEAPSWMNVSEVTNNSFLVTWQDFPYKTKCRLQYALEVKPGPNNQHHHTKLVDEAAYRVSGLQPYTEYKIRVFSATIGTNIKYSTTEQQTTVTTLPPVPGRPGLSLSGDTHQVVATWTRPPGALGNVTYLYRYKVTLKFCDTELQKYTNFIGVVGERVTLPVAPYTRVEVRLRAVNEGGQGEVVQEATDTPPAPPENNVENIDCSPDYAEHCLVTLEKSCKLVHGPDLSVHYLLQVVDQSLHQYDSPRSLTTPSLSTYLNDPWTFTISLPGDLLAYTRYRITAYPANAAGRNRTVKKDAEFTTKPQAPGNVINLKVQEAASSLTVTWDGPHDTPPKGQLEMFTVSWQQQGTIWNGQWNNVTVLANTTSYIIQNLAENTIFMIKVAAKNKDVKDYGPETQVSAQTRPGKPSPVLHLRQLSVTTDSLEVAWDPPSHPAGALVLYQASARVVSGQATQEEVIHHNTTANVTRVEFSGLRAGVEVEVKVWACNSLQCSDWTVERYWTRPHPPQVTSELQWVTASNHSITIRLPAVSSYPVYQWVVVTRDTEKTQNPEEVGTRAKSLVLGRQDTVEGTPKETQEGTLQERAQKGNNAGSEEWISAKLYQEADNITQVFVVGDGQVSEGYNNSKLQTGESYWLTVVTEATAGVLDKENHSSQIVLHRLSLTSEAGGRPTQERAVTPTVEKVLEENPVAEEEVPDPPRGGEGYQNASLIVTESEYANVSRRIPSAQVEAYLSRAIHSQDTDVEFKSVRVYMDKTCHDGQREEHRRKNRYKNNLPYDDTRVRLPPLPDQPHSDYINASYIQGHTKPDAFIASQGPKDFNADTIGDFWRMIWHTHCPIIIMVANLEENGKVKVAQYWPDEGQPLVKDGIEVKMVSTEVQLDFVIRKMEVRKMDEVREVKQYQYTAWPDHGVPQNPYGLAQMIKHITKEPATGPFTVHCSAGIGRTGTVLLVLEMLEQLNTSQYIDPHQALLNLRNGRPRLVENIMQYIFGHQLLQEVLSGVKTSYTCGEFPKVVEELRLPQPPSNTSTILQQFQKLKAMPKDLSFKFASDPKCSHLNRDAGILPADSRMVFLQSLGGGLETQYVNVARVNGMDRKDAYMIGEHPQSHTVRDLWRLVYERRVPVWTLLHTLPPLHPDFPDVVPGVEPQTVGKMVIKQTGSQVFQNFTEYYVEITVPKSHSSACHKCVLLLMNGWPHSDLLPASPEPLLTVLERVEAISQSKSSSLFTCKDGVTGCGVMMALLQLVARMKLVQEVDVYRSVLSVIYDRPQFITSVEQYDFLHTAAVCYLNAFNVYGNFN